jgi:autotransporter-associated beta strand protein
LPATTQVSIAAGATLDVNGMTQQIAALSGPTGSAVTLGAGQLIVNSATSTQFAGTISGAGGSLVKGGTGTLTLAGNNSYTGSTTVNGGMLRVNGSVTASSKIFVAGTGTFEAAGATQTLKSAAVAAGGALRIAPTVGGPARQLIVGDGTHTFADAATSALAISGGTVDVSNNALVVRFAPGNDLAAAAIRGYIVSARNGPAADWQGPGITSGTAIADPGKLAVGYALSSELLGPSGGTFMGAPVDGSSVLVRATLGGDATLDGRVDFADLVQVAQHYGTSATADVGWLQGDFDYNGTVDFADLVRLAQNYNGSLPAAPVPGAAAGFQADLAAAFAAVPEPGAALGVIALVGVLAVRRRH